MKKLNFVLMIGVLLIPMSALGVTFTDSTFDQADWTTQIISSSVSGNANVGFSLSGPNGATGNPAPSGTLSGMGNAQSQPIYDGPDHFFMGYDNPFANTQVAFFKNGATYTPSVDGEISSIDWRYDVNGSGGGNWQSGPWSPLIRQNGAYYCNYVSYGYTPIWSTVSAANLGAGDFNLVYDPSGTASAHPDFSAAGPQIDFGGYVSGSVFATNGSYAYGGMSVSLDNWQVTVSSVPEPSALVALFGLVGLTRIGFRFKRRS